MLTLGLEEPAIEPTAVANAVVSQLLKTEGAQLVLPHRISILSALRGVFDWFGKRPKRR